MNLHHRRENRIGSILLAILLAAPIAAADEAPAPPGAAEDADVVKARERFRVGQERFAAHDYEGALKEFESARLLKAVPEFDFNIAVCLEHLGRTQEALGTYRTFIDETVDAAALADARARIAHLEAPAPPSPLPSPPPRIEAPLPWPAPSRSYTAPITMGVGALALAAIAVAVMVPVLHEYDYVSSSWDRAPTPQLAAEADYLKTRLEISYALYAAAGVAAAIDLILWIRAGRRESAARTVSAPLRSSRGALLLGGRF